MQCLCSAIRLLPKYLTHELERIQNRALAIMCPGLNYNEAITRMDLLSLNEHHRNLCNALFNDILNDKSHRLRYLLSPLNKATKVHFKMHKNL